MKRLKQTNDGFTLLELIVVIVSIVILVAVIVLLKQ